ncbi:MAG: hypothetical protein H7A23_04355 [Leptospiraceae bacterium]|nr:hypothetical protein [Leptospiraceae bacterium]MCP5493765.1 hypothetical protein [Leptospiraceae bacterium]
MKVVLFSFILVFMTSCSSERASCKKDINQDIESRCIIPIVGGKYFLSHGDQNFGNASLNSAILNCLELVLEKNKCDKKSPYKPF